MELTKTVKDNKYGTEIQVIDNFLDAKDFMAIREVMSQTLFDWHFADKITSHLGDDNPYFYFCHLFYNHNDFRTSPYFEVITPILKKLDPHAILRVKGNLYPNQGIGVVEHSMHSDYPNPHYGALFSLNTCDGYTRVGDTKIPSVENRILIFDPSIPHTSTTTSDAKYRMNINLNLVRLGVNYV